MALPMQRRILREPWEVDPQLIAWDLHRAGLLRVRSVALAASADATDFHAANAAGTFSYHHGIYALRDEFIGAAWLLARPDGIEVIWNEGKSLLVGFANVDLACNDEYSPQPRSKKGSGAERASQSSLFPDLPKYAPLRSGRALYYLMVDERGATELSRPIIQDGTFIDCVDRLYLSNGDDLDPIKRAINDDDGGGIADNFDPQVIRKRG